MTLEVGAMTVAGIAALVAGFALARGRFRAASGMDRIFVLAPVFEAAPLAVFSMEHLTAANDLVGIVPKWLPAHLFWVYFFGVALLAAAVSFVINRCVRLSALLLAFFFLLMVVTLDVPGIPKESHERFFWILTFRETSFAGGALVLAGSVWPGGRAVGAALMRIGRWIVAGVMVFYSIEHFMHPHNVVGVPLEKITPAWMPAAPLIAYLVGFVLLVAGVALFFRSTARIAAAGAGTVLLVVTFFFYIPILVSELHSAPQEVEGLNYIYDTMLWAATVLLAGLDHQLPGKGDQRGRIEELGSRERTPQSSVSTGT